MQSTIHLPIDSILLEGFLHIPKKPQGIVLFVHGNGSSHLSSRNNFVAKILNQSHLATLLIDLLSPEEDQIYENRFDMDLITKRVTQIIAWIQQDPKLKSLSLGLFGASTGAAAALMTAAKNTQNIQAIVSRGGRPDLAFQELKHVKSPTLFIVGENDFSVLKWNQEAYNEISCEKKLEVIHGATHLFEEPGCLEHVASLATKWFTQYLTSKQ